jgi:serine/threonine protein kinase
LQSTISPHYQPLLAQHQLASFEQLWNYQGDWFEPPNRERGGWSGVNYIELTDDVGAKHGFYLKRQQGHLRRSWRHPIAGEPTFLREFEILQHLKTHQVATPECVFFGRKQDKAILLTKALTGFFAADVWLSKASPINIHKKRALTSALADAVHDLHQAKVQHRSLYLKHMFIKENNENFDVAMIDFEKSRITSLIAFSRLSDLISLSNRTLNLNRGDRLFFFKQYFQLQRLTPFYKKLYAYLHSQSNHKK